MSKKQLLEMVKEDFQMPDLPDDETTPLRPRTKGLNSARLIPITDLSPDPDQPRKTFTDEKLRELAASIKEKGIIQPITVRPSGNGKYVIVVGERRFRAAQKADLREIPCIVRELTGEETLILQMIENLQRQDLNPVEEATGIKRLVDIGLTQTEISGTVGKSQPYVSQILKILDLPEIILKDLAKITVSKHVLLLLTKSENPEGTWQEIKHGKKAEEIKKEVEKQKNPKGRPKNYRYHYNPKGKDFRVTVEFRKTHAENGEIRAALEETLNNLHEGPTQQN